MTGTATVTGVMTLVQERRFQLADDEGRSHLFVLAQEAPLDEPQLQRCADGRTRIRVRYRDAPHLLACLALSIEAQTTERRDETRTA